MLAITQSYRLPQKDRPESSNSPYPRHVDKVNPAPSLERSLGNQVIQQQLHQIPKAKSRGPSFLSIGHATQPGSSSGQPLDSAARGFMESRFGHDFSHVRVFTDSKSATSADRMRAAAYTSGENVFFAKGWYEPTRNRGRRLLAQVITSAAPLPTIFSLKC